MPGKSEYTPAKSRMPLSQKGIGLVMKPIQKNPKAKIAMVPDTMAHRLAARPALHQQARIVAEGERNDEGQKTEPASPGSRSCSD